MEMSMASATIKPLLAAALLATSIGCGSQSSPIGPRQSSGEDRPIVPASNGGLPGLYRVDVVMSRSGTATVTLQWPDGDYSLQLYVTSGACPDVTDLLTGVCTILGRTRPGDLPGVVVGAVTSGDLNTIWVLNRDSAPQPFTIDMRIE